MQDLRHLPRILISPYWNPETTAGGLYRPVTSVTYALDRVVAGGMNAGWFHLVNVLLHGLVTLLVTRLALDLLPGVAGPGLAGLLFAIHPVHVEAVAGVVGRAEILAACGVLVAVILHLRSLRADGVAARRLIAGAWGATLFGMFAKESAIMAPVLCLLADFAISPRPIRFDRRRAVLYAGYGFAAALFLSVRFAVLGTFGAGAPIPFVDNPAAHAGWLDGRLTALGCVTRYARLLLWPTVLSADYSYAQIPVIRSLLDPYAVAGLVFVMATVVGGWVLLRRAPVAGFSLLWIAVSACLTTNLIIFIGTLLGERLMYLPSVGLCLLFGWGVGMLRARAQAVVWVPVVLLCGAASWYTWQRLPDWRDDFALYRSAARVSPNSARIRFNLGNAHLRRMEYAIAEKEYRLALSIYSEFNDARMNLGMAVLQLGRPREAIGFLETVTTNRPGLADAWVNLGTAHRALGQVDEAEQTFKRALEIDPHSSRAHNNLGAIALTRGEVDAAINHLEEAVRLDPGLAVIRVNLGDALVAAVRVPEADARFEEAYRRDPALPEALRGMGEVMIHRGDHDRAERYFRDALTGAQPSARAANFLGYLQALKGDLRAAIEAYEMALSIDPTLHDAHHSLGMIYLDSLGDAEKGRRHLERSLEIAPDQPEADEIRQKLSVTGY